MRAALLENGPGDSEPVRDAQEQRVRNPLALTPEDVTEMTGVEVQTLYNWRSQTLQGKSVGPRPHEAGRQRNIPIEQRVCKLCIPFNRLQATIAPAWAAWSA